MAFYCGVGVENCWIAPIDRPGQRLLDVFLQMGHYDRWEDDLRLARDLGINAIRYSVPWYLSNPAPNQYDWDNGLYVIDKAGGNLDRVPTLAAEAYRKLAREWTGTGK